MKTIIFCLFSLGCFAQSYIVDKPHKIEPSKKELALDAVEKPSVILLSSKREALSDKKPELKLAENVKIKIVTKPIKCNGKIIAYGVWGFATIYKDRPYFAAYRYTRAGFWTTKEQVQKEVLHDINARVWYERDFDFKDMLGNPLPENHGKSHNFKEALSTDEYF